jgi:hypothetical protein
MPSDSLTGAQYSIAGALSWPDGNLILDIR